MRAINPRVQKAIVNGSRGLFCSTTPLCTQLADINLRNIFAVLAMVSVRKESNGQACSSRVAARLRSASVNTFVDTVMASTWNIETMRSGPENFMVNSEMRC